LRPGAPRVRLLARFGKHAVWFVFTSDRFDHSSDLPADANAGNRFYGRDVAEFINAGLAEHGLDASFFDEDWGWQVHGKRPDDSVLEISIYHNPDENPATSDDWALMLRLLTRERMLGIVPRFREVEVDDAATSALDDGFRAAGVELRRTDGR
jgi:hypothetical protein